MDSTKALEPAASPPSAIERAEEAVKNVADQSTKNALTRLLETVKSTPLRKSFEEFKKEIQKKPLPPEQQIFSFLPHQLAKTSIFFPMSDRELKEENRKITKIEHKTNWGKVIVEGIKLAIFEEDVLLALLIEAKQNYTKTENAFILDTHINKIVNILYGRKGYSRRNEQVILNALRHFELVSFELITGAWEGQGQERIRVENIRSIGQIVSGFDYNTGSKQLKIHFNPRFFIFFLESMLTNINLTLRQKLKKDGSKALLRFLSTHTNPGQMRLETVLEAINYNTNQPMYGLRRRFKQFLAELKKAGVLSKKSHLSKNDMVSLDILSHQKHPQKSLEESPYSGHGKPV